MKQRRRFFRVRVAALGVALAAFVIIVWGYSHGRDDMAELDQTIRQQLRQLAAANAATDAELLRARYGFAANYDELVARQAATRDVSLALEGTLVRELRASVLGDYSRSFERFADAGGLPAELAARRADAFKADPAIEGAWTAVVQDIGEREKLIHQIKLGRARVTNSSQYLPLAMAEARSVTAARRIVDDLEALINRASITGSRQDVNALMERVEILESDPVVQREPSLWRLVKHARFAKSTVLDDDVRSLTRMNTAEKTGALEAAYDAHRAAIESRQARISIVLAAISMVLASWLVWVLQRLARMNASARRFVPFEFLQILGKDSLADVERGDAVRREMSVVFSDIRDFTRTSERRTPEQNFAFMNEYLGVVDVPIHEHHGFVNQYLGDGIMALFPAGADDAVRAAIAMFAAVEGLNARHSQDDQIQIGVGINTGWLMLGTLGGDTRMNAGVISDVVNLAARVESLTRRYACRVLISDHTRERLRDPSHYTLRAIDRVFVKGASRPVTLFEVIDADPPELRERKTAALPHFEAALRHFYGRAFAEARARLADVLLLLPDDAPTLLFMERCDHLMKQPPPPLWDGTLHMESKQ